MASGAQLLLSAAFWWWTLHCLLAGRITWRRLFPGGLVTAICYSGVGVYVTLFGSSSILSNEASYGPIGAVMTLLTIEVGLGVALHLGAVIGATIGGNLRTHRVQEAAHYRRGAAAHDRPAQPGAS
jgi:membrane protein